jgi:hypothetical protein
VEKGEISRWEEEEEEAGREAGGGGKRSRQKGKQE